MSAPDILANVSRGWNRDPAGVALGTERTGLSAALWRHDLDDVQEVWADPDPERLIVGFPVTRFYSELSVDGAAVFARTVEPWTVHIVHNGLAPRAIHKGRFSALHLYLPHSLVSQTIDVESRCGGVELIDPKCRADPVITRLGREVLCEMRDGHPLSRLRIDLLGLDLAIQLLRRHSNLSVESTGIGRPAKGGLAPWQERRATEHLRAHLDADIGLDELAELVNLSTFHFARMFKQSTGLPPHAYLRRLRCDEARRLLETTDLSVTEIALSVGYDSSQALARMFGLDVGVSPSEYRRERRS